MPDLRSVRTVDTTYARRRRMDVDDEGGCQCWTAVIPEYRQISRIRAGTFCDERQRGSLTRREGLPVLLDVPNVRELPGSTVWIAALGREVDPISRLR